MKTNFEEFPLLRVKTNQIPLSHPPPPPPPPFLSRLRAECEYSGSVVVREVLTGGEVHVAVTASGTADEGHETAHT